MPHAGELIEKQVFMNLGLVQKTLRGRHAHPTFSEAVKKQHIRDKRAIHS